MDASALAAIVIATAATIVEEREPITYKNASAVEPQRQSIEISRYGEDQYEVMLTHEALRSKPGDREVDAALSGIRRMLDGGVYVPLRGGLDITQEGELGLSGVEVEYVGAGARARGKGTVQIVQLFRTKTPELIVMKLLTGAVRSTTQYGTEQNALEDRVTSVSTSISPQVPSIAATIELSQGARYDDYINYFSSVLTGEKRVYQEDGRIRVLWEEGLWPLRLGLVFKVHEDTIDLSNHILDSGYEVMTSAVSRIEGFPRPLIRKLRNGMLMRPPPLLAGRRLCIATDRFAIYADEYAAASCARTWLLEWCDEVSAATGTTTPYCLAIAFGSQDCDPVRIDGLLRSLRDSNSGWRSGPVATQCFRGRFGKYCAGGGAAYFRESVVWPIALDIGGEAYAEASAQDCLLLVAQLATSQSYEADFLRWRASEIERMRLECVGKPTGTRFFLASLLPWWFGLVADYRAIDEELMLLQREGVFWHGLASVYEQTAESKIAIGAVFERLRASWASVYGTKPSDIPP